MDIIDDLERMLRQHRSEQESKGGGGHQCSVAHIHLDVIPGGNFKLLNGTWSMRAVT